MTNEIWFHLHGYTVVGSPKNLVWEVLSTGRNGETSVHAERVYSEGS